MISHCRKESPVEACGILAGKIRDSDGGTIREVLRVYPCKNELNSPIEYRIGAEEQFKIFSEIDDQGLDLLGFYHSHPYSPSRPSSVDGARANYFGYCYVIVSLCPQRFSSWVLEKKGVFVEEEVIVADESG